MIVGAIVGAAAFAAVNVGIDIRRATRGLSYQWPNPAGLLLFAAVGALVGLAF